MNYRKTGQRSRLNSVDITAEAEKWRQYGRRQSTKSNYFEEDSDSDESEGKDYENLEEEFFGTRRNSRVESEQDIEVQLSRKQTLILATLVPNELLLLEKFDSQETKRFVGVLLMADVSGYTALSEKYNNAGKSGTYRLTVTLNTYLGALIELIYNHGGDVIKFAGDAFLALWKTDKSTFLSHTIHSVIVCALIIQHLYSTYETDVKVNLKVKLAISAGNLIFAPIGKGTDMNYVIFGLPVLEAKMAESLCTSGEVKVTPTAWGHLYSRNYDYILHDDGHVIIRSILYDPREKDVTKPFLGLSSLVRHIKKPQRYALETLPEMLLECPDNALESLKRSDALNLRRTVLKAEERNIGFQIRKFMIRPVLTQIDAHQPLEYLTEMRPVSVLFITLKPKGCPFMQLMTIVNNSYEITCEIVYKSMGCVNKIILFDKDVMILVIFGLRGFKHESEAQAALKCAYSIKKSVSALDGVLEVSIGVTTGQVYCGVVGHPLRREFTVIGSIVNKAARLMCYYKNKITCDESTLVKSKMSTNGFKLQPKTELKGIAHPGKIFEYTEEIRVKELYDIPMILPILNRANEIAYFQHWLDVQTKPFRDFDAILLIGESRIGKSRLLEWMGRYAKNNKNHVCFVNLTSIHSASPYLALSQILNKILGIKEPIQGFEKEERIVQLLNSYSDELCYLNKVLKVRFAYHENMQAMSEDERLQKAKYIFRRLLLSITENHVICLDDLQSLDPTSWEFISIMFESPKIFTVFTITKGKFGEAHKWLRNVLQHNNLRKIVLGPLSANWIAPLACQILDVDAVANDLCTALRAKCKGMPGLVESFLIHLFSSGALDMKKVSAEELQLEELQCEKLQFPDCDQLHPQALHFKNQNTLDELIEANSSNETSICIVTKKEELEANLNEQNLDVTVMIQIDSLTPYQQLLLKIASVIGNVFSRDLLENIMYENNPITTAKAVKRLFSMKILMCANTRGRHSSKTTGSSLGSNILSHLSCACNFQHDPEAHENLPKYAFCKVLKFKSKNSRKTCYELLPMNQKKEFHSRVVYYLENNKQTCPSCGGELMLVQSVVSLSAASKVVINTARFNYINEDNDSEDASIQSAERMIKTHTISSSSSFLNPTTEDFNVRKTKSSMHFRAECETMRSQASPLTMRTVQSNSILRSRQYESGQIVSGNTVKRVTIPKVFSKKSVLEQSVDSINDLENRIIDKLREVTEAHTIDDWKALGIEDSFENLQKKTKNTKKRIYFDIKLEKGVSRIDFTKCTCAELQIVIFEQLIHHSKQAELKVKTIEFLIQYSNLNLIGDNVDNALPKLEEAEALCQDAQIKETIKPTERRILLGKIHSLISTAKTMKRKLFAAKHEIDKAFKINRIELNKFLNVLKPSILFEHTRRHIPLYRNYDCRWKANIVFCLNAAVLLYSAMGDDKTARQAASKAIELVQKYDCDIKDICDAFSSMMQLELKRGCAENSTELERMAKTVLNSKEPIHAEDLCSCGKLFLITFRGRVSRGELFPSIRSGLRSVAISHFLQADSVTLEIIPDLFYVLLARKRIAEAIDIVKDLLILGQRRPGLECETWYYALCLDLVLDAGFQLESPNEISRFAEYTLLKIRPDCEGYQRLIIGLWTYWLRSDAERKARRYESEALGWIGSGIENGSSLTSLISSMRLAEGLLEGLASKVDDLRKVVDLVELRSLADKELSRLEKDARLCRSIYPRWLLLRANSYHLSERHGAAATGITKALDEALKTGNRLEEAKARAASSETHAWVQNARNGSFPAWQKGAEMVNGAWHDMLYRISTTRIPR